MEGPPLKRPGSLSGLRNVSDEEFRSHFHQTLTEVCHFLPVVVACEMSDRELLDYSLLVGRLWIFRSRMLDIGMLNVGFLGSWMLLDVRVSGIGYKIVGCCRQEFRYRICWKLNTGCWYCVIGCRMSDCWRLVWRMLDSWTLDTECWILGSWMWDMQAGLAFDSNKNHKSFHAT